MDFATLTQAVTSVGFPIAACVGLFYLYDKTIKELTQTLAKIDNTLDNMSKRLDSLERNVKGEHDGNSQGM